MRVKNKIFYQVATDRNYKVGDKLIFGEEDNGQAYHVYNTFYQVDEQPLHRLGFESAKNGKLKDKDMIVKLSKALEKYDFAFRELAIEEVRQQKFPTLPSRMKCMFLTDSESECLDNLPKFANKDYGKIYQAIAVRVTGEIFYSRDIQISREGLSINKYKELAEKYWSQNQNSTAKTKEILFVGEAEIVEILAEIRK